MKKDFWKEIKKPIIGLAPMEGYTDSSFRRLCKEINPDIILYTEFNSADALHYKSEKSKKKFSFHQSELPLVAQIFGKHEESFITATKFVEDMGFSAIDINMGCPSKKVFRSNHGMALRKDHDHAFRLIEAVAQNTSLPVSVKTRLGLKDSSDLIDFCKGAEQAGADMICIHGRTYKEPYSGLADFDPIYELKNNLSIPVLGNGGITSIEDGMDKLGNLDGFLIGQASFGNPWVFLPTDKQPKDFKEKISIIKKHAQYLIEDKGQKKAMLEIRKHLLAYVKGLRDARKWRRQLIHVTSLQEVGEVLELIAHS
ncbi:tRNA dihydrouridine synthase [Candidatus Margulisiibacteriota bacterium]